MKPIDPSEAYAPQLSRTDGDADLVARMHAGDEQALATLYDRWEFAVRAAVLRIVDRPMDAEEVVEDVFWQAWRAAGRFDGARGSVSTWLQTIARSRALDRVRRTGRLVEVELGDDDGASGMEAPAPSPDDSLVDAERSAIIRRALHELPTEQRRALELAYYEGFSQSDIARHTGIPLGTVKTRMRLALQKLRESLAGLGGSIT
ncbi:MAG: sigma-70 family RNA polymerase sigma factor [Gemmatimonadaceae bacterium]